MGHQPCLNQEKNLDSRIYHFLEALRAACIIKIDLFVVECREVLAQALDVQ